MVVVDNGSDDGSGALAAAAGATVVDEPQRGYGNAYLAGFAAARGDYIVMIDADLTYDFDEIPRFVPELDDGADLVMGNRLEGLQPGSMSLAEPDREPAAVGLPQPALPHAGPRRPLRPARNAPRRPRPARSPGDGMELASEMVIRAVRERLDIRELPIALHPREGESKLSRFRDGWRHLRLMLVYHPNFLFLFPGVVCSIRRGC